MGGRAVRSLKRALVVAVAGRTRKARASRPDHTAPQAGDKLEAAAAKLSAIAAAAGGGRRADIGGAERALSAACLLRQELVALLHVLAQLPQGRAAGEAEAGQEGGDADAEQHRVGRWRGRANKAACALGGAALRPCG